MFKRNNNVFLCRSRGLTSDISIQKNVKLRSEGGFPTK